jgi:hypothetical protein
VGAMRPSIFHHLPRRLGEESSLVAHQFGPAPHGEHEEYRALFIVAMHHIEVLERRVAALELKTAPVVTL